MLCFFKFSFKMILFLLILVFQNGLTAEEANLQQVVNGLLTKVRSLENEVKVRVILVEE